jgi:hypothetical protein
MWGTSQKCGLPLSRVRSVLQNSRIVPAAVVLSSFLSQASGLAYQTNQRGRGTAGVYPTQTGIFVDVEFNDCGRRTCGAWPDPGR